MHHRLLTGVLLGRGSRRIHDQLLRDIHPERRWTKSTADSDGDLVTAGSNAVTLEYPEIATEASAGSRPRLGHSRVSGRAILCSPTSPIILSQPGIVTSRSDRADR